MICLEAQYFNLNRILLQATALWPFQQSKLVQFQFITMLTILITAIIYQITAFITSRITSKLILEVLSCTVFFTVLLVHYSSFRINMTSVKSLMEQLHYACKKLTDKNEVAMMQKYGWDAKRYTTALVVLFLSGIPVFLGSQIAISSPDVASSINGSQSRRLRIVTEYFIDQEKCFYLILLHMNAAFFIGILSFIAMGTLVITYLQHICGMFRIACYRIEHAIEINIPKNTNLTRESSISKKLICGINIHREAMKLSERLISKFDTTYFCLTIFTVIALSLNLFQIFQTIASEDSITNVSVPTVSVIALAFYMFFANFFGQNIMDHNNEVYAAAYNIQWYMCPVHIQRLILLLIQRRSKEFHLICGGLFIASFECFATLAKATMSYFTLIYSAR
ncbi:hypothetical protein HN011_000957 [Eciton burchellii]|nr:hypothetical protein HN011_000957 [Eciton burchellii]